MAKSVAAGHGRWMLCGAGRGRERKMAHLVTIRVEKGFKVDDVGMCYESHDLQFTVLKIGGRWLSARAGVRWMRDGAP